MVWFTSAFGISDKVWFGLNSSLLRFNVDCSASTGLYSGAEGAFGGLGVAGGDGGQNFNIFFWIFTGNSE